MGCDGLPDGFEEFSLSVDFLFTHGSLIPKNVDSLFQSFFSDLPPLAVFGQRPRSIETQEYLNQYLQVNRLQNVE
jgi:hypothetical protein